MNIKFGPLFALTHHLFAEPPDFEDGLILRRGSTVEHVCHTIHRSIVDVFKYALVWVCISQMRSY